MATFEDRKRIAAENQKLFQSWPKVAAVQAKPVEPMVVTLDPKAVEADGELGSFHARLDAAAKANDGALAEAIRRAIASDQELWAKTATMQAEPGVAKDPEAPLERFHTRIDAAVKLNDERSKLCFEKLFCHPSTPQEEAEAAAKLNAERSKLFEELFCHPSTPQEETAAVKSATARDDCRAPAPTAERRLQDLLEKLQPPPCKGCDCHEAMAAHAKSLSKLETKVDLLLAFVAELCKESDKKDAEAAGTPAQWHLRGLSHAV